MQQFPIREERNVNDVISMTDNEDRMTTFVRTRPALHEAEAEAENFVLETTLSSMTLTSVLHACSCDV